jgi:hypothetical protein
VSLTVLTIAAVTGGGPAAADDPGPRPARPPVGDPGPLPPKPAEPGEPATEDLPAGFASWQALFDEQHRLNGIADRIVAAGGEGYAGLVVDPENHDVRLYWKGAVPAAVQTAVDTGRATAPVQVYPAAYTEAELRAEAQRWIDTGRVSDAYPAADGSGVTVEVPEDAAATVPTLPGGARAAFTVEYGQEPMEPLPATTERPAPPAADQATAATWNRQYDVSPFWGGAAYYTGTSTCTGGFPVTDRDGYPGLLTAAHCGNPGQTITTANPATTIGQIWWTWGYHDISLIWVYSNVEGRVYTGPVNSGYGRPVNSAASNYVGNYVCVSGAASGEHCAVKVYYASPSDVTVRAERTKNGACAVAHGDSGGPVISQSTGAAFGHGIISAGSSSVSTCGYGYFGQKLDGYHRVMFKGLKFTLGYFGATLRTAAWP